MAVKSPDHSRMYYLAANIAIPGNGTSKGVWAKSGPVHDVAGLIVAVDGIAHQFSDYPEGGGTDAQTSVTDKGAQDALSCL